MNLFGQFITCRIRYSLGVIYRNDSSEDIGNCDVLDRSDYRWSQVVKNVIHTWMHYLWTDGVKKYGTIWVIGRYHGCSQIECDI